MLALKNATLMRGNKILFEHVNIQVFQGSKIGIVGNNGCGKSSLFSLLLNQIELQSGEVAIEKNLRIAYVEQEIVKRELSAIDYALSGDAELFALLSQSKSHIQSPEELANYHQAMEDLDAYSAKSRAAQLLSGLGFKHTELDNSVASFSGGWQMRLNLAKTLMSRSDILLLDEPTNHLDLEAIYWLEQHLQKYSGSILIISHDREFLDAICRQIISFEGNDLKLFNGNFSQFEKLRTEQLAQQQSSFLKQQKEISHIEEFIRRFKAKATKAKQAQSRIKALSKIKLIAPAHIDRTFQFSFFNEKNLPHTLIKLEDVELAYGSKIILSGISLSVFSGDRIGLLGANGQGKSTLVKCLAGKLTPISGLKELNEKLKVGYFAQHQLEQLNLAQTPMQYIQAQDSTASTQNVLDFLGRFGFSGDICKNNISLLSGGEKARLVLAGLVLQKPNLLLLDEPTNHLDMQTRDALVMALQEFDGAMIIISHDRHMLNSACDNFLLIENCRVIEFEGDLNDYRNRLYNSESFNLKPSIKSDTNDRKATRQQNALKREQISPYKKQLKQLEKNLASLIEQNLSLEGSINDPTIYESHRKSELQSLLIQKAQTSRDIEALESEILILMEQIEELEKNG